MSNARIASKIRKLREMRNYTQGYMAEQLGIKQNTYSYLESGQGSINEERLASIGKVLGVPVEELRSPDPFVLTMNHNHGNNGYVTVQNQQQHLVSEKFVQQLTDQLSQVIKDQQEILRSVQKDRSRMLDLLEYLNKKAPEKAARK